MLVELLMLGVAFYLGGCVTLVLSINLGWNWRTPTPLMEVELGDILSMVLWPYWAALGIVRGWRNG